MDVTAPVVVTPTLAGHAVAVLADDVAPDAACPIHGVVAYGRRRRTAWIHRASAVGDARGQAVTVPSGHIGLSRRLGRALRLRSGEPATATVQIPPSRLVTIHAAIVSDLPVGNRARVSPATLGAVTLRRGRSRWSLLTYRNIAIPVRLTPRRYVRDTELRAPFLLRALIGAQAKELVQLSRPPARTRADVTASLVRRSRIRRPRWVAGTVGLLVLAVRAVDGLLELTLRPLFRAPSVTLITTQAYAGDDDADVVRLHAGVFRALGLDPGDQVLIEWCGLRAVARALEDYAPHGTGQATLSVSVQMVERVAAQVPEAMPPHLVARIPALVREGLGMPAVSVIEVRRRVRPYVQRHLNQLVVPVGGLVLTGVAVEELRGWPVALAGVAAFVFGLANLRMPRPPRGRWP